MNERRIGVKKVLGWGSGQRPKRLVVRWDKQKGFLILIPSKDLFNHLFILFFILRFPYCYLCLSSYL